VCPALTLMLHACEAFTAPAHPAAEEVKKWAPTLLETFDGVH
jgi:hypothetical protein